MSDLSQRNNEPTEMAEGTDFCLDLALSNKAQGAIAAAALKKKHLQPIVRKKKILKVKQQLAEGKYNIDKRLSIALDYLLEDIIG